MYIRDCPCDNIIIRALSVYIRDCPCENIILRVSSVVICDCPCDNIIQISHAHVIGRARPNRGVPFGRRPSVRGVLGENMWACEICIFLFIFTKRRIFCVVFFSLIHRRISFKGCFLNLFMLSRAHHPKASVSGSLARPRRNVAAYLHRCGYKNTFFGPMCRRIGRFSAFFCVFYRRHTGFSQNKV